MDLMKATVYEVYGPPEVLHVKELDKPIPADNEVLIKIRATSVTLYDCWLRSANAPPGFRLISRIASGIRKPKQPILGTDLAGEVEAAGRHVTRFKPGDQVFGFTGMRLGTYAEYSCLPEDATLAPKPTNLSDAEAAAVPQGALTALYFLQKGNIQPGQKVLIFGASGGVGRFAVQLSKYYGAEVTGVCSTTKMEMVKSLGADYVIDYTREDFSKRGETYDVIFDTVGKSPFRASVKSLNDDGIYLFATFGLPKLLQILWLKLTSRKRVGPLAVVEDTTDDLIFLTELIEAGKIKSVIDRCYPLEQAAEAHRYFETGQKTGAVIITMTNNR
jgi:NADPH:quinone reductase-like Zn-dependent oxidoreductase